MSVARQGDSLGTIVGRSLSNALFLRQGESWPVVMLLLFSFFVGLAQAFLQTAATALFLGTNDNINNLPQIYVISAGLIVASGFVIDRVQGRVSVLRFLPAVLLLVTVCTLLFGAVSWVHMETQAWYYGLMIWFYVITTLLNIVQLALPSLIFDIRQAKRLFGLISSGELLASMLGYLLVPLLVVAFGTAALVTCAALTFLFGAVVLVMILRRYREQILITQQETAHEEGPTVSVVSKEVLRDRYIVQLCLLVFFSLSSYYFIDFAFNRIAAGEGDTSAIATFLGYFFALGEGLNFVIKTFFSGRIVNRFGVRVSLSILPILLLIGTMVGGAFSPAMGFAVAIAVYVKVNKLFDTIFRGAVHDPGLAILYQPLRPKQRMSAQTLTQGIVDPLSMGIAGAALLVLSRAGTGGTIVLVTVVTVMTAGWIVVTFTINRDYTSALMRAMKRRILDGGAVTVNDMTSRNVLYEKLKSPLPGEVVYALDILERNGDAEIGAAVLSLAEHPSEDVRVDVLERVARLKLDAAVPLVSHTLGSDASPRIRAAAVKAYCALYEEDAVDKAGALLDDDHIEVRIGAMTGLLRNGGIDGILVAADRLIRLGGSQDAKERAIAARVIGEVGVMSFYRPLRDLLNDPDPAVEDAAILAAGRIRNMRLLPLLIEALRRPHVHAAATVAIAAMGPQTLPALGALFEEKHSDVKTLIRASRVMGRIRGASAIELLLHELPRAPEPARTQVLLSLNLCQYRAGDDPEVVIDEIRNEVSFACFFLTTQAMLSGHSSALLRAALSVEIEQIKSRLFYLLSFMYDPHSIFRARDNLVVSSREHRAYALEMLDMEIAGDTKRLVFPLFEEIEPEERIARLQPLFEQPEHTLIERLRELFAGPENHVNSWTKACALHLVAETSLRELHADVEHLIAHPERYVREMALVAVRAVDPERYEHLIASVRVADPYSLAPVVSALTTNETRPMLLSIEKVIILKTVDMFSETPDDVVAEVASILEEEVAQPGQTIIKKGDVGNCMYIIHEGRVRVHDGEVTYAELGARQFFGEFSLLDNETRSATITAIEETVMLRLDQDAFYEIMSDRIEVARGIIRELTKRLRRQNEKLMKLKRGEK